MLSFPQRLGQDGLDGQDGRHLDRPLADPSILGVSSGASFGVVTAIFFLGPTAPAQYIWFAFDGALVASSTRRLPPWFNRHWPDPSRLTIRARAHVILNEVKDPRAKHPAAQLPP